MDDESVVYAKAHKKEFLAAIIGDSEKPAAKTAIFMAGTPGAGKSEVAITLMEVLGDELKVIDADAFRESFPGYNGRNSSDFQAGAAWLVDYTFSRLIEKHYSFILDGTFAFNRATQNVQRALDHDYKTSIYFVYQEPQTAWRFTKIREKAQGRMVPKERFINAYLNARANVIAVQKAFGDRVTVNVVFKNFENNISDIAYNVKNIELLVPEMYTEQSLEEMLDD